jgi:hypothetical protein
MRWRSGPEGLSADALATADPVKAFGAALRRGKPAGQNTPAALVPVVSIAILPWWAAFVMLGLLSAGAGDDKPCARSTASCGKRST